MSAVDGDAGAVRRRQLVLFSAIAALVLVVLAVWLTAGGGGRPAVQGGIEAELAGPDIAEKVWTRRSEARIGTIETRLREIETEARRLGSENERLRQKLAGDAANARSVIDRQAAVIDALERQMNAPPAAGSPDGTGFFRPAGTPAETPAANPAPAPPAPLIETFELKDAGSGGTGPGAAGPGIGGLSGAAVKPVGRWLPPGPMPRRWCSPASTRRPGSPPRAIRARCCSASPARPGPPPKTVRRCRSTSPAAP